MRVVSNQTVVKQGNTQVHTPPLGQTQLAIIPHHQGHDQKNELAVREHKIYLELDVRIYVISS